MPNSCALCRARPLSAVATCAGSLTQYHPSVRLSGSHTHACPDCLLVSCQHLHRLALHHLSLCFTYLPVVLVFTDLHSSPTSHYGSHLLQPIYLCSPIYLALSTPLFLLLFCSLLSTWPPVAKPMFSCLLSFSSLPPLRSPITGYVNWFPA